MDFSGAGAENKVIISALARVSDPGNFFTDPDPTENENPGSGSWPNLDKNSKFRIFLAFFSKEKFCGFPLSIKKRLKYSNP